MEAARAIAKCIDPVRNRSASFARFRDAIVEANLMKCPQGICAPRRFLALVARSAT